MSFSHSDWNQRFLDAVADGTYSFNDAVSYGVTINRVRTANLAWRVIGVHHLTGEENQGNHNAFFDVLDAQGRRVPSSEIYSAWKANNRTNIRRQSFWISPATKLEATTR